MMESSWEDVTVTVDVAVARGVAEPVVAWALVRQAVLFHPTLPHAL